MCHFYNGKVCKKQYQWSSHRYYRLCNGCIVCICTCDQATSNWWILHKKTGISTQHITFTYKLGSYIVAVNIMHEQAQGSMII